MFDLAYFGPYYLALLSVVAIVGATAWLVTNRSNYPRSAASSGESNGSVEFLG